MSNTRPKISKVGQAYALSDTCCRTLVYLRSVMVLVSRGWADNPCRSIGEAFAVSVFVSYDRLVGWKLIEASGASLLRMAINGKMSICI